MTMNESKHTTRTVGIGVVTALMLSIASTAFASPAADSTRSITVSYGELDLSRPAGAQVLYQRIERAALTVCNNFSEPFSEMHTKASACYKNAVTNAVAYVNSEQLFAIYRAHITRVASN
jgi:UrcA family protein